MEPKVVYGVAAGIGGIALCGIGYIFLKSNTPSSTSNGPTYQYTNRELNDENASERGSFTPQTQRPPSIYESAHGSVSSVGGKKTKHKRKKRRTKRV